MITKTVRFSNLSVDARREYGVATIPFAKGEWFGHPDAVKHIGPDSRPFYIRAFGAKWADGSHRYGQAFIPLTVKGNEQKEVELFVDSGMTDPAPKEVVTDLPIKFSPPVIINDQVVPAQDLFVSQVEANPARTVLKIHYRTGNFVVETYVYFYKEQGFYPFEVRVTGSNPANALLSYPVTSIVLNVPGAILGVYGAERRGAQRLDLGTFRLAGSTSFGDGQSQCWYGNVFIPNVLSEYNQYAADTNPMWGISLDWAKTNAYGPFGTVPEAITKDPAAKYQHAAAAYSSFYQFKSTAGNLWDDLPMGVTKNPAATGDQRDFGMIAGWDAVESGRPELLEIYRFNALEEAMRPGHYKEASGAPVTAANHPNWIVWSGVTHWHPVVSPDKLGKTGVATEGFTNSWFGKDNEHWSSNMLGAAALLTHSYQLVDELNVEAELFLSGHTVASIKPGWATNDMGASRAVGRVYNAMAHNYLITGRADIAARVLARTNESVAPFWKGRNTSPVRPLQVIGPDGRQLPLHPSWLPWQEALGIPGLEAWYQLTGQQIFRDIALAAAISFVTYGWRITRRTNGTIETFDVGNAVRWYEGGAAITPEQYFDTTQTYYNPSGIMHGWTVSALKIIAERYSTVAPVEAVTKAAELLQLITAGRTGVYDRMGEWLV